MDIAPQTWLIVIINILLLGVFIAGVIVANKSKKDQPITSKENTMMVVVKNLGLFTLFIIVMCAQAYSVNCMVFGNCFTWSWIITAVIILASVTHMGIILYMIIKHMKDAKAAISKASSS